MMGMGLHRLPIPAPAMEQVLGAVVSASMQEQEQEDAAAGVASTLACPNTPQQPARQVPVGSGTKKGGWVWITGSGQPRQLAAKRLTRAGGLPGWPAGVRSELRCKKLVLLD